MKRIINIIFTIVMVMAGLQAIYADSGSGQGYDPTNPPEPDARFRVSATAAPSQAGYIQGADFYAPGDEVCLYAEDREGFVFNCWKEGDTTVSTEREYRFTMPNRSKTLVAFFDYKPESPEEPINKLPVRIYASPSEGGGFYPGQSFLLSEGESKEVYVYSHDNYIFQGWRHDGRILPNDINGNPQNPLIITMGDHALEYTAIFAVKSPDEPATNGFNEVTGQMILEDFQPGQLVNTIQQFLEKKHVQDGDDFFSTRVNEIVVVGPIVSEDLRFVNNLKWGYNLEIPNCTVIDFSRTSAANPGDFWLPDNSFSDMPALTKVILPANLNSIGYCAFNNCPHLSEIVCYGTMPAAASSESFGDVPRNAVLRVPSGSMSLYASAEGWKDFNLEALDNDAYRIILTLPDEAADSRYRNMTLVLENPASGRVQRLVVNDRLEYVFSNLVPDSEYNLYLRNEAGETLASILSIKTDNENEKTLDLKFEEIKGIFDLTLTVEAPEIGDVTGDVEIQWSDEDGKYISTGSSLKKVLEGSVRYCKIGLPQSLGTEYYVPEEVKFIASEGSAEETLTLTKLPVKMLSGRILDNSTGNPLGNAYVSIEQLIADKYLSHARTIADASGVYSLPVVISSGTKGKVNCGATDYLPLSDEVFDFSSIPDSKDFELKPITGAKIYPKLNWYPVRGEGPIEYQDYDNIEFTLYNSSAGKAIESFSYQNSEIVIIDEVEDGDVIDVTVGSRKGEFEQSTASVKVMNSDITEVSIDVVEHGMIDAIHNAPEDVAVNASLYDENGHLVKSLQFDSKKSASFSGIKAGNYTLVAMRDSRYYQAVNSYDALLNSGLVENENFAMASLEVADGKVTSISFGEVPELPEPDFLSDVTLTVNKTTLTVGNYVTVRVSVGFNDEYKADIQDLKLRFDIPEGCSYVNNSLIKDNRTTSEVEMRGGSLFINNVAVNDVIRFCLMPEKGEEFRPTAFAEFDFNGDHYSQPIGSVRFVGEEFKIFVPKRTCREYVYARGVTTGISDVTLFANGIPSGNARSTADGNWVAKVELIDPEQSRTQQIYGEVLDSRGNKFPTLSTLVEYDPYYPELEVVKMVHNGTAVNFDHSKAKTSRKSYSYQPGNDMFSFMAKFDENKDRVSAVTFHIIATDGTEKTLDGVYVESTQSWVAAIGYPDSYRLPVNVTVEFVYTKLVSDPENPDANIGELSDFYVGYIAPDVTPIIDPSGFVYEAYEDNRLEGVKVTVFYREGKENIYGEIEWETVKWDAAEYAQENPLFTDADGLYAWDVPPGEWQVKYEKDGYDTAYSAWLPVPPPQLEVNMGMVQNTRPEVTEVHAYANGVSIQFDKPMKTETLIPANIRVIANDRDVNGSIVLPDASIPTANTVRVEYDPLSVTTGELQLIVSSQVKSYADITMLEEYTQKLSIEKEITEIKADNTIEIVLDEPTSIVVSALPVDAAVGRKLVITNDSPDVIGLNNGQYEYILDENGQAEVFITGFMTGTATLAFAVENSDVAGSKKIDVKPQVITLQRPNSTLADGTGIYDETVIELSTKTPKARIYYTLDGTEPSLQSYIYEGPFTVNGGVVVKAIAVLGNEVSPVSVFNYPEMRSKIDFELNAGWNWISHNLSEPLEVEKFAGENVEQILSLDEELVRDPELGLVGDLKLLESTKSYKIKSNGPSLSTFEDKAINPSKPISLKAGWNWIGYSSTQVMTVDEALCDVLAEKGEYIVGQKGFAVYDGESWQTESLNTLNPGAGYMYWSHSEKELAYNKKIVSNAGSLYAPSYRHTSGPWVVDRTKYPSIMPVIANVINTDGNVADADEYTVLAFCGTECRGIGVDVNGYVMVSVYGNPGDKINFHLVPSGAENTIKIDDVVEFSETMLGSLESPYSIECSNTSGVESVSSAKDIVDCRDGFITVRGNVESIEVFNVDGQKLRSVNNGGNTMSLGGLNPGIHLVVVKADGVWSYHKIMLK